MVQVDTLSGSEELLPESSPLAWLLSDVSPELDGDSLLLDWVFFFFFFSVFFFSAAFFFSRSFCFFFSRSALSFSFFRSCSALYFLAFSFASFSFLFLRADSSSFFGQIHLLSSCFSCLLRCRRCLGWRASSWSRQFSLPAAGCQASP
jgi:hypothetical protein